jgi:NAD(P)-dependent dehydrogenase (short-subunit alcohol dehydrogenase family)
MPFTIELDGLRALVTGAGQGVGLTVARYLAAAGAHVFVNDVVPERAEAAAEQIRASGGSVTGLPFDVTDFGAVTDAMGNTAGVDIVVNNAGNAGVGGWGRPAMLADSDPAEWERFIRVNMYGPMHVTRAALPHMIGKRWGRVITIVSDAGRIGEPGMAAYCAAKAGAAGFARGVAREVGRYAITVNNVALGSMKTPATANRPADDPALKRYIVRRFGEPEDAAGMVLYLASPMSSWVTGQTFAVNGGYSVTL